MSNWFYENSLSHHGVEGQKWGVKNGPPYPLDSSISTGKSLKEKFRDFRKKRKEKKIADQIRRGDARALENRQRYATAASEDKESNSNLKVVSETTGVSFNQLKANTRKEPPFNTKSYTFDKISKEDSKNMIDGFKKIDYIPKDSVAKQINNKFKNSEYQIDKDAYSRWGNVSAKELKLSNIIKNTDSNSGEQYYSYYYRLNNPDKYDWYDVSVRYDYDPKKKATLMEVGTEHW